MKIWKYELEITDYQRLKVGDEQAKALSVAEQNGKLVVYVQLDEQRAKTGSREMIIQIVGTGNEFAHLDDFIGTVVMSYGLVWHVYAEHIIEAT